VNPIWGCPPALPHTGCATACALRALRLAGNTHALWRKSTLRAVYSSPRTTGQIEIVCFLTQVAPQMWPIACRDERVVNTVDSHTPWFFNLFLPRPPNFCCQEGDVPAIKILLKNTKPVHVYCDFFFHGICSSQYEYMSISLKLNNVTFQSRKIKGFPENQADIYDGRIELPVLQKSFHVPTLGTRPRG